MERHAVRELEMYSLSCHIGNGGRRVHNLRMERKENTYKDSVLLFVNNSFFWVV